MEPERKPCCIRGCKRTFRADQFNGEILCGKHYRCDRELFERVKLMRKSFAKATRRLNKLVAAGRVSIEWAERRWAFHESRFGDAWCALKIRAQYLQDTGFFAPKRRGRIKQDVDSRAENKVSAAFERNFQRMKSAQTPTTKREIYDP